MRGPPVLLFCPVPVPVRFLARTVANRQRSRREPHKRLKRFLSPAFTVAYIDNLETYFKTTVRDLLDKYRSAIADDPLAAATNGITVDLMDDLHNVALDMCVFAETPEGNSC